MPDAVEKGAWTLNADQKKVLRYLAGKYHAYDFGTCFPFAPIMRSTKLPRARVRVACRALARKGLLEFHNALWSEYHDRPAGAGYCSTKTGYEFARTALRSAGGRG